MKFKPFKSYLEASARQRIAGVFDENSFRELCPPTEKNISPHMGYFKIPVSYDDGVIAGDAKLNGCKVCLVAQEGRFMGGAIGEVHSAKIVGILKRCIEKKPRAMIFLFDSGGVRLQEANAGEIGVAEIIRALLDVRAAGIPVIGVVGGSCGVFGGAGIMSCCCDTILVSEEARIGVSGPEVIETNMGVDAFDSKDRALVWRTYGGKHRYLQGIAGEIADNSINAFREAIIRSLDIESSYSIEELEKEHELLIKRISDFSDCKDACEVWRRMGFADAGQIPSLTPDEFKSLTQNTGVRK